MQRAIMYSLSRESDPRGGKPPRVGHNQEEKHEKDMADLIQKTARLPQNRSPQKETSADFQGKTPFTGGQGPVASTIVHLDDSYEETAYSPSSDSRILDLCDKAREGYCPKCKTQLLWHRKRFNMGILVFYDACPKCLPSMLQDMSCKKATQTIETLQRDLERLGIVSRDIARIQTELQYLVVDIEESQSTQNLDTSIYSILINKAAKSHVDSIDMLMECSCSSEPPTVLEQIRALGKDLRVLTNNAEHFEGEIVSDSWHIYALCDVIDELGHVQQVVNGDSISQHQDLVEEIEQLLSDLAHTKRILDATPALADLSKSVKGLVDGFSCILHPENQTEALLLRQQMEDMEEQYSQQIAALQSQLETLMYNAVATDAVAVPASRELEAANTSPLTTVREIHPNEVATMQRSGTVEAEVILDSSHIPRPHSIMTVEAEQVSDPIRSRAISTNAPSSRHTSRPSSFQDTSRSESVALLHLGLKCVASDVLSILNVMKEYPDRARVQTVAAEKLSLLTCNNTANVSAAIKANGIDLVIKFIRRFPEEVALQTHGLRLLSHFATDINLASKSIIASADGIELVLAAVNRCPMVAQVQIYGLMAIGCLSIGSPEITTDLGNHGGIQLALKAMLQFPNVVEVQRKGLYAVCNLAFCNDSNKETIGSISGINILVNAMRRFPEDAGVQQNGIPALANLASNNGKIRALIGERGGTALILDAMSKFPTDVSIQEKACLAIAYFAKSRKLKRQMKASGAIELVEKARALTGETNSTLFAYSQLRS